MTGSPTLLAERQTLRTVLPLVAGEIAARETDGSFLEKTLRDALAARLPGARTEQPLRLDQKLWPGRLGGVDILYVPDSGARVGVETKVWDVSDALYDVFKLAAATQSLTLAGGFCVIAGRTRDWRAPSAVRDMSDAAIEESVEWEVATLLRNDERGWARIWSRASIRPTGLAARIRTVTAEPFAMPRVADHEIRIIGVEAVGQGRITLDGSGSAVPAMCARPSLRDHEARA